MGNPGAKKSIQEVARLAAEGRKDPIVKAWLSHCLFEAGKPRAPIDIAKAIGVELRKRTVYFPDPVHVESMQSAAITLAGIIKGGDCDDLSVAYLALCLCAGIRCAAVGHAYDAKGNIAHVLAAVHIGNRPQDWHYFDPSYDTPFGSWTKAPTWEYVISLPDERVLCDADACLTRPTPPMPTIITTPGEFIGVAGIPRDDVFRPTEGIMHALLPDFRSPQARSFPRFGVGASDPVQAADAAWQKQLLDEAKGLADAIAGAKAAYHGMRTGMVDLGISYLTGQDFSFQKPGWSLGDDKRLANLFAIADFAAKALTEAANGTRKLSVDPARKDYAVESLPTDPFVISEDPGGGIFLAARQDPTTPIDVPTGTLGALPVWGAVLIGVALYGGYVWLATQALDVARTGINRYYQSKVTDTWANCLQTKSAADCEKVLRGVTENEKANNPPPPPPFNPKPYGDLATSIALAALGGVAAYGIYKGISYASAAAPPAQAASVRQLSAPVATHLARARAAVSGHAARIRTAARTRLSRSRAAA